MRNFQDTPETRKRSFISTFSICMTVPLTAAKNTCARAFFVATLLKRDSGKGVFL